MLCRRVAFRKGRISTLLHTVDIAYALFAPDAVGTANSNERDRTQCSSLAPPLSMRCHLRSGVGWVGGQLGVLRLKVNGDSNRHWPREPGMKSSGNRRREVCSWFLLFLCWLGLAWPLKIPAQVVRPIPIPGRVGAEDYDTNGPGVSNSDHSPGNSGGAYRTADVDSDARGFLRASGKQIVDAQGQNVILRGMGLGNWMLQEPYMMDASGIVDNQQQLRI